MGAGAPAVVGAFLAAESAGGAVFQRFLPHGAAERQARRWRIRRVECHVLAPLLGEHEGQMARRGVQIEGFDGFAEARERLPLAGDEVEAPHAADAAFLTQVHHLTGGGGTGAGFVGDTAGERTEARTAGGTIGAERGAEEVEIIDGARERAFVGAERIGSRPVGTEHQRAVGQEHGVQVVVGVAGDGLRRPLPGAQHVDVALPAAHGTQRQLLAVGRVAHIEHLLEAGQRARAFGQAHGQLEARQDAFLVGALAAEALEAQLHTSAPHFGDGELRGGAPRQQRHPHVELLVGRFEAAAQQLALLAGGDAADAHPVGAPVVFDVRERLPVGREHRLGEEQTAPVFGAQALGVVHLGVGHGRAVVLLEVVREPGTHKLARRHVEATGEADFLVARDAREVEHVLQAGVAVALGYVVPDALARQPGVAREDGFELTLRRTAHFGTDEIIHLVAPAFGHVSGGAVHEPRRQLQQIRRAELVFERAAVEHILQQQAREAVAEVAPKLRLPPVEGQLDAVFGEGRFAAGLVMGIVQPDVALTQVGNGVVQNQRRLGVGVVANQRRHPPQLLFG